jgi:hypothetical protein
LRRQARFHAREFPLASRMEIHAQIEVSAVAAEMHFLHQERLAVHRSGAFVHTIDSRADPFEI